VIRQQAQKTSLLGLLTCFVVGAIVGTATGAKAEGSRTLYPETAPAGTGPAGSSRANLEWRPAETYGGLIPRSSLMKVYAQKDEYILVGSSAVGSGVGDVGVFYPNSAGSQELGDAAFGSAVPDFKCSTQRAIAGSPATMGQITSRALELAGPNSVSGIGSGYIPCYVKAPSAGLYSVVFYGPTTAQGSPTSEVNLASANNFGTAQGNSVAAWDITVRSSNTSTTDINGRVFSYNMAMFTGGNAKPLNFKLYPVTNDGYRYELSLRNIDPNGFAIYGNQVGFYDQDSKTPLYHDVVGSDSSLTTISGGAKLVQPQFPIFLNTPDAATVLGSLYTYGVDGSSSASGITLTPTTPTVSNLAFTGNKVNNNSVVGSANFGSFTFDLTGISSPVNYEILIFKDGTGCDPNLTPYTPSAPNCDVTASMNRSLRGLTTSFGSQSVYWNGKDNSGANFPIGSSYKAIIKIHPGEYHFPLLDAENAKTVAANAQGAGVTIKKLNGGNSGSTISYYDDRGYRTIDIYDPTTNTLITPGQTVGTVGSVLPGTTPPTTSFSNVISGFDSSTDQRAYGDGSTTGFGDKKGLDLWTYLLVNAASTQLNILPPPPQLLIAKRITKVKTTAITTLIDQVGGTSDTSDNNVLWPSRTGTATQMDAAGTVLATSTSSFSTVLQGATNLTNPTPRPKEELEYTIYYLSSGGQTAKNASICDFVPVNTTYVLGTLQLKSGTSPAVTVSDTPGDTDGGFYPIGTAQAAMHAACNTPDSTNTTRGAVVVNLGDVLNATSTGTPTSSYGYIRFRVVVQ
jgi:uncharacterized repeat protein (TIGR01451 family)